MVMFFVSCMIGYPFLPIFTRFLRAGRANIHLYPFPTVEHSRHLQIMLSRQSPAQCQERRYQLLGEPFLSSPTESRERKLTAEPNMPASCEIFE